MRGLFRSWLTGGGKRSKGPKRASRPSQKAAPEAQQFTMRDGGRRKADGVFEAWTHRDLDKMLEVRHQKTHPVDRHYLLLTLVDETYKLRKERPDMAKLCEEIAEQHLEEFPALKGPLAKSLDGVLPRVPTFQKYATLLAEQSRFDSAIEVCELALSYGLQDGTKSGFEGRIARLRKQRAKQGSNAQRLD